MLNYSVIQGRLTADPELKRTQSDIAVSNFTVAVDRYTKAGEEKQADFINVVAWRQTAEFVNKYFHKGSLIIVEGKIQTRKWKDKDGNNRYATEIVASQVNFCGSKKDNPIDISADDIPPSAPAASVSTGGNDDFVEIAGDDDLPF